MASLAPAPNQLSIFTALRSFLLAVVPGIEVIRTQVNRVPEPTGANWVAMTPSGPQRRLSTNVDTFSDVVFSGSISGATMTVSSISEGTIQVGQTVFGVGVAVGTTVTGLGTGSGGAGTYTVAPAQTVGAETLAAGSGALLQPTEVTIQLDVHGPLSSDNAQTITTLFRDSYGTTFFKATGLDVAPLYCSDPRQMVFDNGEQQMEDRWVVDVVLQANQVVSGIPQQFASQLVVVPIDVQATYH